ncbi:hypothetical protein B0A48_07373 [Cryoendolithus antarcticus]|uniref:Uncharacterized protein n=1 Tax=Cryoendolithus antarcticus TaxID=1507870 RepID=A0A1V8T8C8_9PEZI|nr:hypothetical protein B0A48_07373 [Cryoendolithus antarcticus]
MSSASPPPTVKTSFPASPNPSTHPSSAVESPSLSSSNALARYELAPAPQTSSKSKDSTKVLLVEWEDDSTTTSLPGSWEITWEGKRTVLPAQDQTGTNGEEVPLHRLYFLLGAGVPVPTTISLRKGDKLWKTNPLPAIFSPELGATAREAGKKGVLHTIWAKKRLQFLQDEIAAEARENVEGVGYEMALAEMSWIEANFGVAAKPSGLTIPRSSISQPALASPTSPRSPGGGRLMEKLKGLKLGTNSDALAPSSPLNPALNPLSPETSDVAYSSFGAFAALKGMPNSSSLAARAPQPPTSTPQLPPPQQRRVQAHRPPDNGIGGAGEMGSLNALAASSEVRFEKSSAAVTGGDDDTEDDLFALPMSPRSPEMAKSPFSFSTVETGKYLRQEGKA